MVSTRRNDLDLKECTPPQRYFDTHSAQKMKFSIKDFFGKYDQIRSFLQIWSYLPKKSLMENFIFVQWHLQVFND